MIDTILNIILTGIIAFLLVFLALSFLACTLASFSWNLAEDETPSFMTDLAEAFATKPEATHPNFADMTVKQMIAYIKKNEIRTQIEAFIKQNIHRARKADLYTALLTVS